MQRFDRSRFVAFGVLPAINAIALLLHGLALSTHGTDGSGRAVPAIAALAIICLLCTLSAAIKRGRDLGLHAGLTLLAFWFSLALGPCLFLYIGYLVFAKSKPKADAFGPPPFQPNIGTWLWSFLNLVWPWFVAVAAARIM
ncbi:MAG: DUF805 domain-containing protein [Aquabacterium sp.]|uniref:DUF805 domain-containing protein n=1 Tax=Aquabacterium sp. TaxID=1872578 RepID=UPI00345B919A|nr:DUF805 domain-containing protein [Aquabacterium sp.]